jgi:hypothetical protein
VFCEDIRRIGEWVCEGIGMEYADGNPGIALETDGELKIGVMYESYTGEGGSIMLFGRCDDPKYATRTFYHHIFSYPFDQLGVKVVYAVVNENNLRARRLDEHLGFIKEHVMKDYFPDGDAILYAMRRENCRWINAVKRLEGKDYEQKISPAAALYD